MFFFLSAADLLAFFFTASDILYSAKNYLKQLIDTSIFWFNGEFGKLFFLY